MPSCPRCLAVTPALLPKAPPLQTDVPPHLGHGQRQQLPCRPPGVGPPPTRGRLSHPPSCSREGGRRSLQPERQWRRPCKGGTPPVHPRYLSSSPGQGFSRRCSRRSSNGGSCQGRAWGRGQVPWAWAWGRARSSSSSSSSQVCSRRSAPSRHLSGRVHSCRPARHIPLGQGRRRRQVQLGRHSSTPSPAQPRQWGCQDHREVRGPGSRPPTPPLPTDPPRRLPGPPPHLPLPGQATATPCAPPPWPSTTRPPLSPGGRLGPPPLPSNAARMAAAVRRRLRETCTALLPWGGPGVPEMCRGTPPPRIPSSSSTISSTGCNPPRLATGSPQAGTAFSARSLPPRCNPLRPRPTWAAAEGGEW